MITTINETRNCRLCGKILRGRSDKKFCDDYCRASYNNELKGAANNLVRNINYALSKNRRILESLLPTTEQTAKTQQHQLLQKGFSFRFYTHTYVAKNGNTYFYCYDYGYLPLENNWFLIVKKDEQ